MMESKIPIALRDIDSKQQALALQYIFGAVDVAVMLTDLNHTTLAVNERFGEIFGINLHDTVSNDADQVREFVRSRISNYDEWHTNLNLVYSDPFCDQEDMLFLKDPDKVLDRKTKAILDQDGTPVARLWTFRDITQEFHRQKIETLLSEVSVLYSPDPKAIYRQIVQSLCDFYDTTAIISILEENVMIFEAIASKIPEINQMQSNDLGNSYCQFCIEADGPIIIQNALESPVFASILPATVGVTRYAGVPIRSPEGHFVGTLCVLDHHSHRHLTGDDLRLLSIMSMRVSGELVRESHLEKLRQDLATAESKMIQNEKLAITGTLAASIAHDIRNIVSAITIDLNSDIDTSKEKLLRAQTHIDRFNILALRLLSYAKPKEISLQPVVIEDAILRVTELLARHLCLSSIELEIKIPADFPEISADQGRIDHLLMNLCLNGIQAMKTGGKLTIVGTVDRAHVLISIRDNGPGMNTDQIEQAFKPFQSTRRDGFGLGLYSCKQIMKENHGNITVVSNEEGTEFRLQFPKP